MLKKVIITFAAAIIIIVGIFIAIFIALSNWPTLMINPTTLGIAARHLSPLGIQVEWRDASTTFESHGFMDRTVGLSFDDLCITYGKFLKKSCSKKVEIHARYVFEGFWPRLVALGPIVVEGGNVLVEIPAEKKGDKRKIEGRISLPQIKLPDWLHHVKFYPVSISVDELKIQHGDTLYISKGGINGATDNNYNLINITASGSVTETPLSKKIDFEINVESPTGFKKDDWESQLKIKASLGSLGNADFDAKLARKEQNELNHVVKITYSREKLKTDAVIEGTLSEYVLETVFQGSIQGISDVVPSVSMPGCKVKLVAEDRKQNRGKATLNCPINVNLKRFDLHDEIEKIYEAPTSIGIDVSAQANTFFIPDLDQILEGQVNVKIRPSVSRLVKTDGGLKIAFSGVPSKGAKSWSARSDVDIDFIIEEFSRLVKVMGTTRWPVPAPFNVLNGSIEFSINGSISTISELANFPAKLKTRLSSKDQRIDIDSEGTVTLGFDRKRNEGSDLKLDVLLQNVQLQLPNIVMAGLPRLTPDGRIIIEPTKPRKKEESAVPFKYRVHVSTPPDTPVKILSNFTPKYIPVYADMILENEGISGEIRIADFPVKMFNRSATVKKLDLDLKEPIEMSEVDGSMSIPFPELKVIISVKGTVDQPIIIFDSDPPMPQGDILSTLLYGDPLEDIDSDQASSVSDMSAAMANRAMALTSFFLLGSTPIQSVAYNPQTGVFSAKLRLTKKTSLVVGASDTEKSAMIRQRLGKGFSISAGADKNDNSEDVIGSAYIEWSKRF